MSITPVTTAQPYQTLSVPALSDDEQVDLNALYERLVDKTRRNILRASYYDGKRAIRQVGSVIPPQHQPATSPTRPISARRSSRCPSWLV